MRENSSSPIPRRVHLKRARQVRCEMRLHIVVCPTNVVSLRNAPSDGLAGMRSWLPSAWQPSGAARRWMTRCAGYADGKLLISLPPLRRDSRIFLLLAPAQAQPPVSVNRRVGAGWRQIRYGRSLVCPIPDGSPLLSRFVASPRGF